MQKDVPLQKFIEELAERECQRRAQQIDKMIKDALSSKIVGRCIVWATLHKRMMLARLLSRVVSLELREYRDPASMALSYDVVYAHRVIASKKVKTIEQALTI